MQAAQDLPKCKGHRAELNLSKHQQYTLQLNVMQLQQKKCQKAEVCDVQTGLL